MNQKPSEAGWFYHAPRKVVYQEPVGAPPASQIPGLGEMQALEPEEVRDVVFRDTDTKYVRMAKMGGRKDLLAIKANQRTKKEAVGYPRPDWFYLEDNRMADQAEQAEQEKQWQFLLPEYMVHQSHGQTTVDGEYSNDGVPMRRAPYATETQMQFTQDGSAMTDKTVKLPETRRPGYGVRSAKPAPKGPPQSSQVQGPRPKFRHQPMPAEPEEPVQMGKLLAGTYEREWHDHHNQWQEKQDRDHDRTKVYTGAPGQAQCNNNHNQSSAGSQKHARRISSGGRAAGKEMETKEMFKLSKFKNVPARINTHQSPDVLAAVGN